MAVRVGPNMIVTGHPDGKVRMPVYPKAGLRLDQGTRPLIQMLLLFG